MMAGYKRPLSKNELRQIRRQRWRIISVCAFVVILALVAVSGIIYVMYSVKPH